MNKSAKFRFRNVIVPLSFRFKLNCIDRTNILTDSTTFTLYRVNFYVCFRIRYSIKSTSFFTLSAIYTFTCNFSYWTTNKFIFFLYIRIQEDMKICSIYITIYSNMIPC